MVELCRQNTIFYKYTEARPTREKVMEDMKIAPPGIDPSAKHYFGFFDDQELVAVMDLVDGYPRADFAYVGFFMMNVKRQGRQTGTAIISDVMDYLRSIGKTAVRLAIDKGNPQSTHFWKKNGFEVIAEAYVRPEYRKQGLASAMITFAEKYCKERYALHKYELLTGKKNTVAQSVYDKLGYKDDHEIHMSKRV